MDIQKAIDTLIQQTPNPSKGLPEKIFLFISRTTPLINVDLLIKNKMGQTLLSWRDDQYAGTGWHLPGGIIRFKEKMEDRILKVAENEIGTTIIDHEPQPLAINQMICDHDIRGHFISILYRCSLSSNYVIKNENRKPNDRGYLQWYDACPINLIKAHKIYQKYF